MVLRRAEKVQILTLSWWFASGKKPKTDFKNLAVEKNLIAGGKKPTWHVQKNLVGFFLGLGAEPEWGTNEAKLRTWLVIYLGAAVLIKVKC